MMQLVVGEGRRGIKECFRMLRGLVGEQTTIFVYTYNGCSLPADGKRKG